MCENWRVIFIQRVAASNEACSPGAGYEAMREQSIAAKEKDNVTGNQLVQVHPLDGQNITWQNAWKHAASRHANVGSAERSQHVGNQVATHIVLRTGNRSHQAPRQDCLRLSEHPACVGPILPQDRAEVSKTRSARKAGLLYGFFALCLDSAIRVLFVPVSTDFNFHLDLLQRRLRKFHGTPASGDSISTSGIAYG